MSRSSLASRSSATARAAGPIGEVVENIGALRG
jgi:hypothetical protein